MEIPPIIEDLLNNRGLDIYSKLINSLYIHSIKQQNSIYLQTKCRNHF